MPVRRSAQVHRARSLAREVRAVCGLRAAASRGDPSLRQVCRSIRSRHQASTAPSSLLENAPPAVESDAAGTPEPSEELPISDTPELEPVEDEELDIPALEDEEAPGDQG